MTHKNINSKKVDQAWSTLYARLDKDGLLTGEMENQPLRKANRRTFQWAAAIAVLCLSVLSFYFISRTNNPSMELLSLHNTDKATTLVTTLEDGSMVYLVSEARLNYPPHFEEGKRVVALQGDALFNVNGNKERPFVIETEVAQIEVLGTSFHIKNPSSTSFELSVLSGQVKVTHNKSGQISYIGADETVRLLANSMVVSPTSHTDSDFRFADNVQFKDVRLDEIIRIFNQRYQETEIVVSSVLKDRILTIGLTDDEPEIIAESICVVLNTQFTKEEDRILIHEP